MDAKGFSGDSLRFKYNGKTEEVGGCKGILRGLIKV